MRWIVYTGTTGWAADHRGGEDGKGSSSFDSPSPTVSAFAGALGGTPFWRIMDDGVAEPEPAGGKPAYRIPPMAEIRAVRPNGLKVVSTFAGCGGSCLGFEWAGYRTLLAVEFVAAAADSYRANHPGVPVFEADIRTLTAEHALELAGVARGELDVLDGSPPCESFSTSGKLSKGWGQQRSYSDGKVQRMDDLFYEFVRLLGGMQPRAFVAENVAGLVKGVSKGYFKNIHAALAEQGYRVKAQLLDAQWLGVPQRRQRVIFVGVRNDLGLDPVFPTPLPFRYSIREALAGISAPARAVHDTGGYFRDANVEIDLNEPMRTVLKDANHHLRVVDDPPGEVVRVVHDTGGQHSAGELDLDAPAPTITTGTGGPAGGINSSHFKVERLVYENGGVGGAAQSGRREEDLDAPARAITKAHGASAHFLVERKTDQEMIDEGRDLEGGLREAYDRLKPGEYGGKLGIPSATPGTARYFDLVRADGDEPSPTIARVGGQGIASVTHHDEPRKFSIAELRRICGFPDDFVLTGSYAQQWERLGNSVPPPMMYAVARPLARLLGGRATGGAWPLEWPPSGTAGRRRGARARSTTGSPPTDAG